ncbi:serine/threonine-protein phosphatase [Metamycoplasma hominis]|uniref:PP2C family protein-serine/threonine phosphatase n=1 Tax=Metamycoplasma hominis TaxID=2098 RepID=UPI00158D4393|nr:protein phosphatase 2C domain-containing protein [Metamycoplasma hominis]QKX39118.1 serine/threonine-protein phosphatase [Metamycoplasma hominis]
MVDFCIASDQGKFRKENQDRAIVVNGEYWTLAALCDGMGGHVGGSQCSTLSTNSIKQYFLDTFPQKLECGDKKNVSKWFNNAISFIKEALVNYAKEYTEFEDMGTTMVVALIFNANGLAYVFNIGDSRLYAYNGLLYQITEDQNYLYQLMREFNLTYEEAALDPNSYKLISCLGPNKKTNCQSFFISQKSAVKYYLLTSDGLHDYVSKPIIETVLQTNNSLKDKLNLLIKYAKKNLSKDNITGILVGLKNE